MGSIVGGMYALGYTSDEILEIISAVDWDRLISNQVDRQKISYENKSESKTQLVTIPFSVSTDRQELQSRSFKNSLPTGIVSGDNLINLFNSLSVGYSDPIDFDDLPIPFLCIATNVINGEADVLDNGIFSKSLRASMAIPIRFLGQFTIVIPDSCSKQAALAVSIPGHEPLWWSPRKYAMDWW